MTTHFNRRSARSIAAGLLAVALTAAGLAIPDTAAAAPRSGIGLGPTVSTWEGNLTVSWRTPRALPNETTISNIGASPSVNDPFAGASSTITMLTPSAPDSYQFPLVLPSGDTATLSADGSVAIRTSDGAPLGSFETPWALDATGATVPTYFTVNGNPTAGYTLVQHVDPTTNTTYPIVADPHYTWGIITGTVYFNKEETALIAESTAFLDSLSYIAPPPFDVILSLYAVYAEIEAGYAEAYGECLKIKSTGAIGRYSGGYCQ